MQHFLQKLKQEFLAASDKSHMIPKQNDLYCLFSKVIPFYSYSFFFFLCSMETFFVNSEPRII